MVLVSTGPQKDKSGKPVPTTQPTVLAHISGTSQPVALPLSVVTALQTQAKLQQQQQKQQTQSSTATAEQQPHKNVFANKTTVSNTISSIASHVQQVQTTSTDSVSVSSVNTKANVVPVPITSTVHSQTKPPAPSPVQQSPNKPVDPKLLQQLLFQQGKISVGPAAVTVPQVTAVTTSTSNSTRPQFYQYNNIAKLPSNIVQQLIKTTSPQQVIRVRPPVTVAAIAGSTQNSTRTTISTGNTSGTALTKLIPAGLALQASKVTTLVASTQSNASAPQANVVTDAQAATVQNVAKATNILKISTENLANTNQSNSRSDDVNATTGHIVTVSVSPSGAITSSAKSSQQVKQISPELISKIEAHGLSTGKQPNIEAMIQANPGLFKSLGSPPKQKYASNVTVKSLLEKRALESMKQKQSDGSDTQADGFVANISQQKMETQTLGSKTAIQEANQMQFLPKVSPVLPKPNTKLSPGTVSIRLQSPTAVGNTALAQVMPGGAIRKIQLSSPTPPPQNQVKTQIVQQAATSQIQTVTVNPSSNVLTIPQNLTPQQFQLLQQELVTKFGVQNIPQNIQVVQQVPQQPEASQITNNSCAQVQVQPQTVKQIKVPSGTVTIQPKIIVSSTSGGRNINPKDTTQTSESVIDDALKTVMTTVQTSLPTAQIKVNSPFAAATRNVTMATSAMKSPIPAVPAVEAMSLSPTKTVPVTAINHSLTSTTATSTVTSCVVTSPPSTIIKTAGANAIKIIPDASQVAAKSNTGMNSVPVQAQKQITNSPVSVMQGTGPQKNVIIQMKQQGAQGVALLQNTVHSVNSIGTSKPGMVSMKQAPQTVHNLLLQQKKESGNVKLVPVSGNSLKTSSVVAATSPSSVCVTAAASPITGTGSVTKAQQLKIGGKIPLSPKTKISSLPYMKPQTIQQIMESKAKASSASQQMKPPQASSPQNNPNVVMPGTVPGAPVRIVQASPVLASPVEEAPSGAAVANGVTAPLSPSAGSTMTNVMANIGGKMVQLRVAVGPGQNINQILQSPQLQQQLQQLHQSQLSGTVNKPASGLTATAVQQSQPTVHVVQQQQQNLPSVATSISSTNAIKLGSKTIRALTNMTPNQVQNVTCSPVVKAPAAPHILSAKTAAPRAMLNVNQTALGNPSTQILQTQQTVQLSDEMNVASQNSAANVQQVSNLAGNIGQGKVVLVNVGGQIMAAQAVGGKTVLMPQNVNLVGQNVTGLAQNIPANLVQNVQPKIIATPQAVGAIGLQSVQAQQTTVNGTIATLNGGGSASEDTNTNQIQAQSGIVTSLAISNAGLAGAPVPTPVPMGSLMMVGSGLMPVPTTQSTGIQTPVQMGPSSIVQVSQPLVSQPLPSPTFRHNMPQQVHISRQAMAMATPQVAATPQVSSAVAVGGGLEQLALAAAQVQEAMQTGTTLKSIPGSNESQANNNAQLSNEYAALPNGTSLP